VLLRKEDPQKNSLHRGAIFVTITDL